MATIADMMDEAADECSVSPPSSWVAATTLTYRDLKRFLTKTVNELLERVDWPDPIGLDTTITGTGVETYNLPSDFKRLTRDGFILGYEARLNPALLGAGLLVFIEVLLDRTVHDVMDTFKAAVQVRPEILEAHLVAGGFDYLLKTRVADMAAYREFIGSVIWTLPGVRETRTYAVMEEVKNSTQLKLL